MAGSVQNDFEDVEAGEPRRLLPQPGVYPAEYVTHFIRKFASWGEKLIFEWKVFTNPNLDPKQTVKLCRYYNVKRTRAGKFCFGDGHDYRKDWIAANGGRLPLDRGKVPFTVFQNKTMLVAVGSVTKDAQRPLSPSSYWSKIEWIVGPLEEGKMIDRLPLEPLDSSRQLP